MSDPLNATPLPDNEARAVRQTLNRALAQRSKVHLAFDCDESTLSSLAAVVVKVGAGALVLEISGLGKPGGLEGRTVTAFFQVHELHEDEHRALSCMFTARVARAVSGEGSVVRLAVPLPARLEHAQRRKSLRLRPKADWFEEFCLWRGDRGRTPGGKPLATKKDMGASGWLRLGDLSAGGLRMLVSRDFVRERDFQPVLGELLTFQVRFVQEMRSQPREVWLVGKVVRFGRDPVDGSLDLGVVFERSGACRSRGGPTVWTEAEENVVLDLAERVFAWHTILFRERDA